MRNKKRVVVILIGIIVICVVLGNLIYFNDLKPVNKKLSAEENTNLIRVEITEGMRTAEIAEVLKKNNVIRSKLAMIIYTKLNKVNTLQAGKYDFNNSEDMVTIINHISNGDVASDEIRITFIEGKNMRWFAKTIAEKTNNTENDVFAVLEDKEYIDSLVEKYWFLTDEITDSRIYYPLEGYLLPDTYNFQNKDVSVKEIFNTILNYMEKYLNSISEDINNSGLTVHQALTLASIAELEGESTEDRKEIIGVFYNRLRIKMSLGSDVTAYYAFKVDMGERNLTTQEINTENSYNTRGPNMSGKIPVGPIDNPSKSAIEATLNYKQTDNLYFVADKNGKVYFTKNYESHQAMISKLKREGLWFTY